MRNFVVLAENILLPFCLMHTSNRRVFSWWVLSMCSISFVAKTLAIPVIGLWYADAQNLACVILVTVSISNKTTPDPSKLLFCTL